MDCGFSRIDVTIERKGENTQIAVSNDGQPMSKDILIDKFLTLGGSAKDDGVGDFGKAKELLVCCHLHWSIRTGSLLAEGEGGEYELSSYFPPSPSPGPVDAGRPVEVAARWQLLCFFETPYSVVLGRSAEGEELVDENVPTHLLGHWFSLLFECSRLSLDGDVDLAGAAIHAVLAYLSRTQLHRQSA